MLCHCHCPKIPLRGISGVVVANARKESQRASERAPPSFGCRFAALPAKKSQARGDRVGERRGPAACLLTFEHNPNDQGEAEARTTKKASKLGSRQRGSYHTTHPTQPRSPVRDKHLTKPTKQPKNVILPSSVLNSACHHCYHHPFCLLAHVVTIGETDLTTD